MRNLVISLPKLIHACIIFGTVSNISRDLRRFLVLATAILPLDDGSTGNGRSWILVAEWWQMVYCQLNPVLWLKQFVTQPDIIPHFHEPKLVGRDFERCSVHCLFKFSVGPETSHSPRGSHGVCAWRPWRRVAPHSWTPWPRRPWRRTRWARHAVVWRCWGAVGSTARAVSIDYYSWIKKN